MDASRRPRRRDESWRSANQFAGAGRVISQGGEGKCDLPFLHSQASHRFITRVRRFMGALLLKFPSKGIFSPRKGMTMKVASIALATAFALSGTVALAQNGTAGGPTSLSGTGPSNIGGQESSDVGNRAPNPNPNYTTGSSNSMGSGNAGYGSPNGTAGGPTSLSGTGPSNIGGQDPGAVGTSR
jgi:serine protease autotransporter